MKERSVAKWQTDIKEQRSRLMNRQICFESSDQAESSQTEDKDSKGEVENGDFGLSIDVSQPPILQRKVLCVQLYYSMRHFVKSLIS